ncbi:hypothetical protein HAX54_023244, partial [Datura stramonium]|nr:hypothetical protein [Datura stramonium]
MEHLGLPKDQALQLSVRNENRDMVGVKGLCNSPETQRLYPGLKSEKSRKSAP